MKKAYWLVRLTGLIMMLIFVFVFLVGCNNDLKPEQKTGWHVVENPTLSMVARCADDVYIGTIQFVAEDTHTVEWNGWEYEMTSFDVRVEKTFRGNYIEGEVITDEIFSDYAKFLTVGDRFALCTDFFHDDYEYDYGYGAYSGIGDVKPRCWKNYLCCYYYHRTTGSQAPYEMFGYALPRNTVNFGAKINDDGTLEFFRDGMFAPPENERELKHELADQFKIFKTLTDAFSQDITEIRIVKTPSSDLRHMSEENKSQLLSKISAGDTSEVTVITDKILISKWKLTFENMGPCPMPARYQLYSLNRIASYVYAVDNGETYAKEVNYDPDKYECTHLVSLYSGSKTVITFYIEADYENGVIYIPETDSLIWNYVFFYYDEEQMVLSAIFDTIGEMFS